MFIALIAVVVLGSACGLWFWWACTVPTSSFFRPALIRGPQDGKRISLTFDDGPAAPFTSQILEVLHDHQVPATFFLCGRDVEQYPELVQRIAREGHEVGNHTYSHLFVYFKTRRRLAREIDRTQDCIERLIGRRPRFFRPPYGARWFGLVPTLRARGMHLVLWSATGYDWIKDAPGIVESALEELRPGAVILLHDGQEPRRQDPADRSRTVEALPQIIAGARARGYSFVPLGEFLPSK